MHSDASSLVFVQSPQRHYFHRDPLTTFSYSSPICQMTEGFAKARWLSSWAFHTYCLPLKLALRACLQAAATSGVTQTCPGVSSSLSELLERAFLHRERHGSWCKRRARWEETVNRWPFRKGVDH